MLVNAAAKICGRIDVGHCTCKQSQLLNDLHVLTYILSNIMSHCALNELKCLLMLIIFKLSISIITHQTNMKHLSRRLITTSCNIALAGSFVV